MSFSGWTHLKGCDIKAVTEKGLLVENEDGKWWIPRSQVDEGDTFEKGMKDVTVSITEFIAKKLGIEPE